MPICFFAWTNYTLYFRPGDQGCSNLSVRKYNIPVSVNKLSVGWENKLCFVLGQLNVFCVSSKKCRFPNVVGVCYDFFSVSTWRRYVDVGLGLVWVRVRVGVRATTTVGDKFLVLVGVSVCVRSQSLS